MHVERHVVHGDGLSVRLANVLNVDDGSHVVVRPASRPRTGAPRKPDTTSAGRASAGYYVFRYDASRMAAPLFSITDLAKVYHMGEVEVHALKQVNLDLFEGQFV